jgi:hypothetical protein
LITGLDHIVTVVDDVASSQEAREGEDAPGDTA